MTKWNCIIAEDEPLAQKQMVKYIEQNEHLNLLKVFSNGLDALKFLQENNIDLVFFDINMPQLSGMELAKMARKMDLSFKLIFTTAFTEYAVDSYKVNADDYLLKPFSLNDFNDSIEKLISKSVKEDADLVPEKDVEWERDYVFVKSNYQIRRIKFDEIQYFEGLKDYIQIYLKGEKHPVLILTSFKKVIEKLPENKFMRIHRSYIVNLDAVEKVERNRVIFNDIFLPISDGNKDRFFDFLKRNSLS